MIFSTAAMTSVVRHWIDFQLRAKTNHFRSFSRRTRPLFLQSTIAFDSNSERVTACRAVVVRWTGLTSSDGARHSSILSSSWFQCKFKFSLVVSEFESLIEMSTLYVWSRIRIYIHKIDKHACYELSCDAEKRLTGFSNAFRIAKRTCKPLDTQRARCFKKLEE